MAKEVVIQTWCDIEFDDEDHARIDARTITWFLYGTRMEIDLCPEHVDAITIANMDVIVQEHGRVWEDPTVPIKKKRRRKSRADTGDNDDEMPGPREGQHLDSRGNEYVLREAHIDADGQFVCTVAECPREGEGFPKITGLRMHQRRVHDMHVPDEEKVKH